MTREELEARSVDLQRGLANLRSQINETEANLQTLRSNLSATDGALQECKFWLAKMTEDDEPAKPEGWTLPLKAVP